jgi:hypothetical protein
LAQGQEKEEPSQEKVIALVVWNDAHMETGEIRKDRADTIRPVLTHSVGHVVSQNSSGIVLAVDAFPDEEGVYANWHFIPTGMLVSVTPLNIILGL